MISKVLKIGGVFLVTLGLLIWFLSDFSYKVSLHTERLKFHLNNKDAESARKEIENLKYFHGVARKWRLERLADRYLFKDFALYEPAYYSLIGDFDRVIKLLANNEHYQASHVIGVAKFRKIKDNYGRARTQAERKKIVQSVIDEVSPYFRKAVEDSPEFNYPDPNFDDRFNYDMTSDEKSAQAALASKPGGKKIVVGPPKQDDGKEKTKQPEGKKPDAEKRLNEETKPGLGGNSKKKG